MKLRLKRTTKTYYADGLDIEEYMVQSYAAYDENTIRVTVFHYCDKAQTYKDFATLSGNDEEKLMKWALGEVEAHAAQLNK